MKEVKIIPINVPDIAMPKKDLDNPCPCQDIPIKLKYKKGIIFWCKDIGEFVEQNEVICEAEVEKKSLEILSPCKGILVGCSILDGDEFNVGDILGYVEELQD